MLVEYSFVVVTGNCKTGLRCFIHSGSYLELAYSRAVHVVSECEPAEGCTALVDRGQHLCDVPSPLRVASLDVDVVPCRRSGGVVSAGSGVVGACSSTLSCEGEVIVKTLCESAHSSLEIT